MAAITEQRRKAFAAARSYLDMRGYEVIEQSFRRARVTIDLIAQKDGSLYFLNLIYDAGTTLPLDAVTAQEARRLELVYAIQAWTEETKFVGIAHLGYIEVAGPQYHVMSFQLIQ